MTRNNDTTAHLRLNNLAYEQLRDCEITPTEWVQAHGNSDGSWTGDTCGCPDSRCQGFHHLRGERCGCLSALAAIFWNARSANAGVFLCGLCFIVRPVEEEIWELPGVCSFCYEDPGK